MTEPVNLSVVLPCYNEADNLPFVLERFRESLEARKDAEVILVDNGSTDNTGDVLSRFLGRSEFGFARTVRVAVNRGYGFGIMSGLRESRGSVLSWTHADMQTDPAEVVRAYDLFVKEANQEICFLKGRRSGRPIMDTVFTAGMSVATSVLLGVRMTDVNAQPKMFHHSFLHRIVNPPDDFFLEIYVFYLVRKLGMRVIEYPVVFGERKKGEAKGGGRNMIGRIRLSCRTIAYAANLRRTMAAARHQEAVRLR